MNNNASQVLSTQFSEVLRCFSALTIGLLFHLEWHQALLGHHCLGTLRIIEEHSFHIENRIRALGWRSESVGHFLAVCEDFKEQLSEQL